jgi:hypothetical protein
LTAPEGRNFRLVSLGISGGKRDVEKEELKDEVGREVGDYAQNLLPEHDFGLRHLHPFRRPRGMTAENGILAFAVWVLTYKAKNKKMYYYAYERAERQSLRRAADRRRAACFVCSRGLASAFRAAFAGGYFLW